MLINQTITTGYFPEELKLSRVKPLFKNGDSTLISNYRPISLLPSLSKVYERVIFDQLFHYMLNNNLWLRPLASQYLLLVLCNVQAYIKMLLRVTC